MKNKHIVEEYLGDLDHFIFDRGYPIVIQPHHKKLCKLIPVLHTKDGLTQFKEGYSAKDIDPDLRAEFWKFKYNEIEMYYSEMYDNVMKALNV